MAPMIPAERNLHQLREGGWEVQVHQVRQVHLFKKYPNLPHQLRAIADSTDPPRDESSSGQRLNANPRRKKEVWTQEIGLQNGMNALRKGLAAPRGSTDGEGLREYCELFKYQLAQKAEQGEDPDAEFRRRAAQHDAEVIRKLMDEDEKQKD
ncbi:hypothetical protein PG994_001261 [Apiospora phragmitis]|uniref:Uncharacterized protein n=1 Tax=Apiospora phragmitis TaxID=2905665 RepID=A0ABR1WT04_9PEZI